MEKQTTQEIVEQLYCIRAGLSLICECQQKIENYENEKKRIKQLNKDKMAEIKKRIERQKEIVQTAENRIRTIRTVDVPRAESETRGYRNAKKCLTFFLLLAPLLGVGGFLFDRPILGIVLALASLFGALTFGLAMKDEDSGRIMLYLSGLKNAPKNIAEQERIVAEAGDALASAEEELASLQARTKEEIPLLLESHKKAHAEEMQEATSIAEHTYQALISMHVIDQRDWGVLDFVIYALETGRADTLKEALQVADQERRSNTLVEAVTRANAEVVRAIQISARQTQSVIRDAVGSLSRSVSALASSVQQGMRSIASSMKSGFSQIAEGQRLALVEQRAQTALLEKATWDSQRLADMVGSSIDMDGNFRVRAY